MKNILHILVARAISSTPAFFKWLRGMAFVIGSTGLMILLLPNDWFPKHVRENAWILVVGGYVATGGTLMPIKDVMEFRRNLANMSSQPFNIGIPVNPEQVLPPPGGSATSGIPYVDQQGQRPHEHPGPGEIPVEPENI